MLEVISIFISIQKTRNGPKRPRKSWPKNAHADPSSKLFFQEAVELAVSSDKSNPEAFHIAASYLISSSKFDEAKVELKRGLDLWIADHESAEVENEESLLEELQKEKLDPEIRMSALRLTVELEMWDESITIGRWRQTELQPLKMGNSYVGNIIWEQN